MYHPFNFIKLLMLLIVGACICTASPYTALSFDTSQYEVQSEQRWIKDTLEKKKAELDGFPSSRYLTANQRRYRKLLKSQIKSLITQSKELDKYIQSQETTH